jgi:uncharacterized protein (TIGR02118 family)
MAAARSGGVTIVYELAFRSGAAQAEAIQRWFDSGPAKSWRALPHLQAFDAYVPARGEAKDPYVHDGAGPCLICMLSFPDADALRGALASASFQRALADAPAGASITAEAMVRKFYGADGETGEQTLVAPFSYVVRYHRPAEDERAFVAYYVADHPAILARFPNIRSVLCDFPIPWRDPNGLASPDYMLGNEVAFDSLEDFNAAMASPVRHELRAHYRNLPRFSGRNTHYPMMRTRVFPGSSTR